MNLCGRGLGFDFICIAINSPDHEEDILDDLTLEPLIELLSDHLSRELKLLHPDRAGDLDEKRSVADLCGVEVGGDGRGNDVSSDRPHSSPIQARRELKPLEQAVENRAELSSV